MTQEVVIDLAKFVIGAVFAFGGLIKFFDYLKDREQKRLDRDVALAKENSAGHAAIIELKKEDAAIRADFEQLKKKEASQDDKIEDLEEHYDKLINRVWDFFKTK